MTKIDTEDKVIHLSGYKLENWAHVRWIINFITTNGEILWGKEAAAQKKSATVLSLVKKDDA